MPRDLAIDLGTANTLVYVEGRGIVLEEQTIIAVDERSGDVLGIGREAWAIADAQPSATVVRPLRHGAITDFDLTERLLRLVLGRVGSGRFAHPRAVVAVSSGLTPVEQRAVQEAATSAGARSALLIEEPMAAALGADLPIERPSGNCVIDVGGGTTEVAVISMGGIVARTAVQVGGLDLDEAIRDYLRTEHEVTISERMAEAIKREVGSASPMPDEPKAEIAGRDLGTGAPRTVVVASAEIREAIDEPIARIVEAVRRTLAATPPELSHDVLERGMVLTGGGALLTGLDARIAEETDIPVHLPDDPLRTVCIGAGRALAGIGRFRNHDIFVR